MAAIQFTDAFTTFEVISLVYRGELAALLKMLLVIAIVGVPLLLSDLEVSQL
jgi:hypothetical protein